MHVIRVTPYLPDQRDIDKIKRHECHHDDMAHSIFQRNQQT